MKPALSLLAIISAALMVVSQVLFFNQAVESPKEAASAVDDFFQSVISLPRYVEAGYSPLGRSPVVDVLLADPLYLPIYAEEVAETIKTATQKNSLFALETALQMAGGLPTAQIDKNQLLKFNNQTPLHFQEAFKDPIANKIYGYWRAFLNIHKEVETVLSVLNQEEKNWIKENYNLFFFESQNSEANYDFFTTDNPYPLKFFELASRIDLAKLADCSRKLSLISDDFYANHEKFCEVNLKDDFIWEQDGLKFIISQKSYSTHTENADFFIDLGGYNTFYSNAGGTEGTRALALHIDLKGHNSYHGQNFIQGSGFLGVGHLISFGGNNTYNADSYSQGCGFFGVGSLVNIEDNNHFNLNFGGQSFALFGFSLLWNKKGHNVYVASQGMAQAASSTLGVAFLVDSQGNNTYLAGNSQKKESTRYGGIGQGGSAGVRGHPWLNNPSFYGGLSFMYLGEGNNKLKNVWLAQGSAYFLGAGILVEEGSHDIFEADYDSQGQGLHLASGLILRKGEFGHFNGGWGSLGTSGDRSVGMFINLGGNNRYQATDHSMGASRKPKSLGAFINIGGNNEYIFEKLSNARLQFPQSPNEWSSALFLEIGSDSTYPQNVDEFKRENNSEWGVQQRSLGLTTEYLSDQPGETLFAKFHKTPQISFPFNPLNGWTDNTAYQPLIFNGSAQSLANEIGTANYDRRRQIYEILDVMRFKDRKAEYDLSYILQNPTDVETDAFNFAVIWALRNKDKVNLDEIKNALKTEKFKSEYARKMAVSLVGTFWSAENIPLFSHIMQEDPSEEIRYYAALALTLNLSENSLSVIKQGLKSPSERVRFAIAKGLQESKSPFALELAVSLFNDKSFYVRRAAGLTAISLSDKRGIPVVLETLQFETLDTEENYGLNIYQKLAGYLGVDFGLDKQGWINWWALEKNNFKFSEKR